MKISLVVPAYDEERGLPLVVEEYLGFVDEIIVVDDGSKDGTFNAAKKLESERVKLFQNSVNSGKVAALRNGIGHATGDILFSPMPTVPILPDMCPKVEAVLSGADLVLGARLQSRDNIPTLNRIGNNVFSFLASYISCMRIQDSQTGLRAFRREMFDHLDVKAKGLEFETKMTVRAAKLGYKIVEIPIEYRERVGRSKLRPLQDGARMFSALFSVAYSETSLLSKMMLIPSMIFIFMGFLPASFNL